MGCSKDSRYGMMYDLLKANSGGVPLMLSLEDSLARISVAWAAAKDYWEINRVCGATWQGLSAKFNPLTCSWKMSGISLDKDSGSCLAIWPLSGMMQDGVAWEQTRSVLITRGIVSGFWPTPTVQGDARRETIRKPGQLSHTGTTLLDAVMLYPTPTSSDYRRCDPNERRGQLTSMFNGGLLNPDWVEWLMGVPLGWTGLKPLGMDKYQQFFRLHGLSLEESLKIKAIK